MSNVVLHSPPLSFESKLFLYGVSEKYSTLNPDEQAKVFQILNQMPDESQPSDHKAFNREVKLLSRKDAGSLINSHDTTCWFNALVQAYYEQPEIRALLEKPNTPYTRKRYLSKATSSFRNH